MIVIETLDELKDYVKKVTAEQRDALSKKEEEVEKVYSDTAKGLLSVWGIKNGTIIKLLNRSSIFLEAISKIGF